MEKFIYLDDTMYGLGNLTYISGEKDYVVLIRPISRMEIIDTDDWRNGSTGDTSKNAEDKSSTKNGDKNGTKETKKTEDAGKTGGSSKPGNAEIVEKARKKSGAPLAELDGIDPDGTLNIHLYEDAGDHTATWDWYYINPDTLTGVNTVGDPVDLN
jgi:hypothetical protein